MRINIDYTEHQSISSSPGDPDIRKVKLQVSRISVSLRNQIVHPLPLGFGTGRLFVEQSCLLHLPTALFVDPVPILLDQCIRHLLMGRNLIYEDGELSYIELPASIGRKEILIPIIRSLRGYLEEYFNIRGPVAPDEYIFIYMGGTTKGHPVRGDRVYREFKRYAKVANIPSTRSLHGMRHQAVTTWIEKDFIRLKQAIWLGIPAKR